MEPLFDNLWARAIATGRATEADIDKMTDAFATGEINGDELVSSLLEVGDAIILTGLKSRADLNDCRGFVLKPRDGDRWPVRVLSSDGFVNIRVKAENLRIPAFEQDAVGSPMDLMPAELAHTLSEVMLPRLNFKDLIALSECSKGCRDLVDSATPIWNTLWRELEEQHGHVVADSADVPPLTSENMRERVCFGVAWARSHIERITQYLDLDEAHAFNDFWRYGADEPDFLYFRDHPIPWDEFEYAFNTHQLELQTLSFYPRQGLLNALILLNMAREDLQGARMYFNPKHDKMMKDRRDLDDKDEDYKCTYFFDEMNAPWEPGVLEPCTGSSFNDAFRRYILNDWLEFDLTIWDNKRLPIKTPPLWHMARAHGRYWGLGSDAHIEYLIDGKPEFLTPSLWGDELMVYLDVLGEAKEYGFEELCEMYERGICTSDTDNSDMNSDDSDILENDGDGVNGF